MKTVTFKIEDDKYTEIIGICKEKNLGVSTVVRDLLSEWLVGVRVKSIDLKEKECTLDVARALASLCLSVALKQVQGRVEQWQTQQE